MFNWDVFQDKNHFPNKKNVCIFITKEKNKKKTKKWRLCVLKPNKFIRIVAEEIVQEPDNGFEQFMQSIDTFCGLPNEWNAFIEIGSALIFPCDSNYRHNFSLRHCTRKIFLNGFSTQKVNSLFSIYVFSAISIYPDFSIGSRRAFFCVCPSGLSPSSKLSLISHIYRCLVANISNSHKSNTHLNENWFVLVLISFISELCELVPVCLCSCRTVAPVYSWYHYFFFSSH